MRKLIAVLCLGALAVAGCGHRHAGAPEPGFAPVVGVTPGTNVASARPQVIVTPETDLSGRVMKVNASGKFVVLNFPIGHLPALDQRLSVYRLGLKVGEVRVTGPQLDDNVVGDLVAGEAAVGDQVREH